MKLLPVTLTLFDKATNNTYKGTLLLKNLDAVDESQNNGTMGVQGDDYDGKGAGLFIILVVSMYALSIVLFIASFITKKPNSGETNDENTVNVYLHKVSDLKEKTARDHFKKLKMSITSRMEMDLKNEKRGRLNSKGSKDMKSISLTSSKNSLSEPGVLPGSRLRSTESIPSTGLLPKEDDATQPLLASGNTDLPTPVPAAQNNMSTDVRLSPSIRRTTSARMLGIIKEVPDTEACSEVASHVGRTMSYHDVSSNSNRGVPTFPKSQSEPENTQVQMSGSTDNILPHQELSTDVTESCGNYPPDEETGSHASLFKPVVKRSSCEHVNIDMNDIKQDDTASQTSKHEPDLNMTTDEIPKYKSASLERPRPRYPMPVADYGEDVWQQMPQGALPPPPPKHKPSRKPLHLKVNIPARPDANDIWVLRNGKGALVEKIHDELLDDEEMDAQGHGQRMPSQAHAKHELEEQDNQRPVSVHSKSGKSPCDKSPRTKSPRDKSPRDKSPRDKSPRDKSQKDKSQKVKSPRDKSPRDRSPRDKSPRDKSPRDSSSKHRSRSDTSPRDKSLRDRSSTDWSPRDWSPRDWSPRDRSPRGARDPADSFFYPHDARSLPRPFRSPSPRSPPRSPKEHYMPPQTRISQLSSMRPGATHMETLPGGLRDHKATLRVTLDRSPDQLEDDPFGCSTNKAFEQSPRLVNAQRQFVDVVEVHGDGGRVPTQDVSMRLASTPVSHLQVPLPRFPVTFNSPATQRKSQEKDPKVQSSNV